MRAHSLLMLGLPMLALSSCDKVTNALSGAFKKKTPAAVTTPKPTLSVIELKPQEFATFTASSKQRVVVVQFHAPEDTANPQFKQQIDALAKKYPYQLAIGSLDIAQARDLAARENVTATPEIRIYRDGSCVERLNAANLPQLDTIVAAQVALQKPNMAAELAGKKSAMPQQLDAEGKPLAPKEAAVQLMQKDWKPAGFERAMVPKADPKSREEAALGKLVNQAKGTAESMAASGSGAAQPPSAVRQLQAPDFETFKGTGNDKVIVVDFYADWCGPCRQMGPALDQVAAQQQGKVAVGKVNVDDPANKELAKKLGVSGIPDVRVFRNGKEVDRIVGFPGEGEVAKKLGAQVAKLDKPKNAAGKDGQQPAPPAAPPIAPAPKGWVPPGMEKGR